MSGVQETLAMAADHARLQKLLAFPRTDAGNAEVFAEGHGNRFRYDHTRQKWRVWNGRYWAADETGESDRAALETARVIGTKVLQDRNGIGVGPSAGRPSLRRLRRMRRVRRD